MAAESSYTLPVAALLTVLSSLHGLLATASKTNGSYAYNSATVPFLAEATKLLISLSLLARERLRDPQGPRLAWAWRTALLFPVPSLIYAVNNNVQVTHPGGSL